MARVILEALLRVAIQAILAKVRVEDLIPEAVAMVAPVVTAALGQEAEPLMACSQTL